MKKFRKGGVGLKHYENKEKGREYHYKNEGGITPNSKSWGILVVMETATVFNKSNQINHNHKNYTT